MIDIRIICTHDALKVAETLTRLLEAEQHRVQLTFGRQAMAALEDARNARDAVILIWSPDARSQTYMLEWARSIDAVRLIELARTSGWPTIKRKAPVIEFAQWRGERGGRAWNALNERLRTVRDVLNPPKGPPREAVAAFTLGVAAAVVGALVVRVNAVEDITPEPMQEQMAALDTDDGLGGPLVALEPASLEEQVLRFRPAPEVEPIAWEPAVPLAQVPEVTTPELRDQTLLERVAEFIPPLPNLRGQSEEQ